MTPAGFAMYTTNNKWMLARHLALLNRKLVEVAAGRLTRLLVSLPPRHGKCLKLDTLILKTDGTYKEIKDIEIGDSVFSFNKGCCIKDRVIDKVYSGKKEVFKITLDSNSTFPINSINKYIEATKDHCILTLNSNNFTPQWITVENLIVGNYIYYCIDYYNSDIMYIKIEAIEAVGMQDTYDIQIEKYNNFIANNIVVHNSELIGRYFPAWYLGNFPNNRVIYASYEAAQAETYGAYARDLLEEFGEEVFNVKLRSGKSAMSRWQVEAHEGGMVSVGGGGALTGKGANLLILDDLLKDNEQAESVSQKEKLWAWFGCFHPDTEYLTDNGFIPVSSVTLDSNLATVNPETLEVSYEKPSTLHSYDYNGQLYEFSSNNVSFCVTPNHNIWHHTDGNTLLNCCQAQDLPDNCVIPQRFGKFSSKISQEDKSYIGEFSEKILLELCAYLMYKKTSRIENGQIYIKKGKIQDHIISLIGKLKLKCDISNSSVIITDEEFIDYYINFDFNNVTDENLIIFLYPHFTKKTYQFNIRHLNLFSKYYLENIGIIALKCGYSVKYSKTEIHCSLAKENRIYPWGNFFHCHGVKASSIHKIQYTGKVYCVTMPTYHSVIIRYKGCISMSGNSTAYTRLQPGGSIVLVATRWAFDDVTGRILESKTGEKWEYLNFPAIAEEDEPSEPLGIGRKKGEALWPEMWPLEALERIRDSGAISSYYWSALYQQRPVPKGGGLFKSDWFRYYTTRGDYAYLEPVNKLINLPTCWKFATCDMANKDKITSDYSVIAIWAVTEQNDLLLLDLYRDHYNYDEFLHLIIKVCKETRLKYIGIENMGVAIALINECIKRGLPIRALEPQGKGKLNRANAPLGAVVRMENGKVYFPKEAKYLKDIELELMHFPKGKTDDLVDCLSYACNELTKLDIYEDGDFCPYEIKELQTKAGNMING